MWLVDAVLVAYALWVYVVWSPSWHASLAYFEPLSARGLPPLENELGGYNAGKGTL